MGRFARCERGRGTGSRSHPTAAPVISRGWKLIWRGRSDRDHAGSVNRARESPSSPCRRQLCGPSLVISGDCAVTFAEAGRSRAKERSNSGKKLFASAQDRPSSVIRDSRHLRARSRAVWAPSCLPTSAKNVCRWPARFSRKRSFLPRHVGSPQPVRLDESNWTAAASGSAEFYRFGPGQRAGCRATAPHVGGLSIIFRALWSGGAALLARRPEPGLWCSPTSASLVPTLLAHCSGERPDTVRCNGHDRRCFPLRRHGSNEPRVDAPPHDGMTETPP